MNQIVSGNNAYPEKLMLGKRPKAEYPQVTREMGDFLAGSTFKILETRYDHECGG
jgi:hypothetical protein